MKLEDLQFRTSAGRERLADALRNAQQSNRYLERAAREGSKPQLLAAMAEWEKSVAQVRQAKDLCNELMGEEVEAWIKS